MLLKIRNKDKAISAAIWIAAICVMVYGAALLYSVYVEVSAPPGLVAKGKVIRLDKKSYLEAVKLYTDRKEYSADEPNVSDPFSRKVFTSSSGSGLGN